MTFRERLDRYFCRAGWHNYVASREICPIDLFPPVDVAYVNPTRECTACGHAQRWMPGYGGTELGHWIDTER